MNEQQRQQQILDREERVKQAQAPQPRHELTPEPNRQHQHWWLHPKDFSN